MIASLEGEVIGLGDSYIVVRIGGLGLQVYAPSPYRARLRMLDHIFVYTHLIVREDLLALYGFESEQERDFFNLLLGVNGVGPRMALAVLSVLSVDAIRRAILNEQSEVFARVPGVGKRTAQKIQLHLQDKIKAGDDFELSSAGLFGTDESVLEALTALGYSIVEAQSAIQNIPRDAPDDLEERLRLALQYFSS
ncbi:MAG: Holliday junction branch migration protein RuvA [Anaerolineaceae bacterium]|nr:Holliday junction branch migration protein RuvA [Anaerolineaceae bacterium]